MNLAATAFFMALLGLEYHEGDDQVSIEPFHEPSTLQTLESQTSEEPKRS